MRLRWKLSNWIFFYFILPTESTKMAFLLMFVTILHLVTLAMLFIATMEKVSQNSLAQTSVASAIKKHICPTVWVNTQFRGHVCLSKYVQNCSLKSVIYCNVNHWRSGEVYFPKNVKHFTNWNLRNSLLFCKSIFTLLHLN